MAERKLKVELEGGVIVHWEEGALEQLGSTQDRSWHLHGEPGAECSALRVLSARATNGDLLLVASLRPADADGHDAELPRGLLLDRDGLHDLHEVLLSTEYDGDGNGRRVGLEMYLEEDGYALRAAGDKTGGSIEESDGWRRDVSTHDFRLGGNQGVAVYEIWHRV